MTLEQCLDIGNGCDLKTVGESIYNLLLHAPNLFAYDDVDKEINELIKERDDLFKKTNFTEDSEINKVLYWLNFEDDDIEYRTLSRNGKCCICGRKIFANKNKVIHCQNYKSNAGTITLCNYCIDRIYNKAHEGEN